MTHTRAILVFGFLAMTALVFAGPHSMAGIDDTPGSKAISTWVEKNGAVPWSQVPVAELAALDNAKSVLSQELRYVYGAAISSYILPGLGQFKVGDTAGGVLHLTGQLALVAGTAYGAWALLPESLKSSSLNHSERHTLMKDYLENDFNAVAPSLGILAGGLVLSSIHSMWAASDAKDQALENVRDGTVDFEPVALGLGFGLRMKF